MLYSRPHILTLLRRLELPNVISGVRLAILPLLLYLARAGHPRAFLVCLGVCLFSDAVDGYLARKLEHSTLLGARLDSWADALLYLTVPVCAWWLWPETILREMTFIALAVASYIVPMFVGFLRFHRLTSYHTWGDKVSAVLVGIGAFLLLGFAIAWPFRVAAVVFLLAAMEEIAITLVLPDSRRDVCSIWHALKQRRSG